MSPTRYHNIEKQKELLNGLLGDLESAWYRNGSTHLSIVFLVWFQHFKSHPRYIEVLNMLVEIASNQETFDYGERVLSE
jgi:hypothetical protein